jgi:hypothetical protein
MSDSEKSSGPITKIIKLIIITFIVIVVGLVLQDGYHRFVEARAVGAITRAGGAVLRDESRKGMPVISVDLQGTVIDDSGRVHFKRDRATDGCLRYVKDLNELRRLSLIDTLVTDAGLTQLSGLRHLEELHLAGTGVTDAGVRQLRQALPGLKVQRGSGSLVDLPSR